MLRIAGITYPNRKAELPFVANGGRANLVEIAHEDIPLADLSKLIGAKVVLPTARSKFISIDQERGISDAKVTLDPLLPQRTLEHIPRAKLPEMLGSDDLRYIVVSIKPDESQPTSNETEGVFVLSKANKRSETGPVFEVVGYADEHVVRAEKRINPKSLQLISVVGEKDTVGSNGSSSVVTGLEAHNSQANAARARVLTRSERDLSKSTRAELPLERIIAARIGPGDESKSGPKILERRKLSSQAKPSPTIERLTDILFTGRDLDLIDELIVDKLGLFDTGEQRDEVIQAGRDSEDKSNRILYTVGRKHCIRYKLDGELDRNLEAWAQKNKSDHAFARGVLGLFYESRRTRINKLAEASRTLVPIRTTQPKALPSLPSQPRSSAPTKTTLQAGLPSDKPKSFPVPPATLPVRRSEPAAGLQADNRPSITSILASINDATPISSTSDIGIGLEKARRILDHLETTKNIELAKEMKIDDGYVRVGFLRLGELRKNKSRLVFYHLGQNEDLVTTKNIGTLLCSATEEPDAFLSGGLGLNKKFLEEAEAEVCAGWLKKDKKNPETLFGKRIKWQLDERRGRPPGPPQAQMPVAPPPVRVERLADITPEIYKTFFEYIKSKLKKDAEVLGNQYEENKIRNFIPANEEDRLEITALAMNRNAAKCEVAYLLGKNTHVIRLANGRLDPKLFDFAEQNVNHAFSRGLLDRKSVERQYSDAKEQQAAEAKIREKAEAYRFFAHLCEKEPQEAEKVDLGNVKISRLVEVAIKEEEEKNETVYFLGKNPGIAHHMATARSLAEIAPDYPSHAFFRGLAENHYIYKNVEKDKLKRWANAKGVKGTPLETTIKDNIAKEETTPIVLTGRDYPGYKAIEASKTPITEGAYRARIIIAHHENTSTHNELRTLNISDGYLRAGFLDIVLSRANSQRLACYFLGQNGGLITEKNFDTIFDFITKNPDHYSSGGVGLNKKALECGREKFAAWLASGDKNAETLLGERIKWQLDKRKGRPPAPPEQIQAKREQIYSIVVESLKSGKELEADETEIFKNYFEDKIKTDAQRTEIINLAKQENNKRNKIVYLLGKMEKIKNTLDGKPDESLNTWASDEANWEHAFGRGVLGKWFTVSKKEEMAVALKMFRQARQAGSVVQTLTPAPVVTVSPPVKAEPLPATTVVPPKGSAGRPQPAAIGLPPHTGTRAKTIREKGNPIIPDTDGKNANIVIQYLTSRTPFPNGFDRKNIPDFRFREQDMVSLIDAAVKGKGSNSFCIEAFWLGLNTSVREYVNRYISAYQGWLEANKTTHSFAKGYYRPRE